MNPFEHFWMSAYACGPPLTTEFTVTSGINGQGYWYNRRTGETQAGSVVGDLSIPGLGAITRFGTNSGDLLINKGGGGGFNQWVTANPGFSITLTFLDDSDTEIVLTSADLDGTPGGSFIRFSLTSGELSTAANVSRDDEIKVFIDPG